MEKGKQTYKLPDRWIWTTIGEIVIVESEETFQSGINSFGEIKLHV